MSDKLSDNAIKIINKGLQAARESSPNNALLAADSAVAHAVSDLSLSASIRGGSLMPLLEIAQLYVREKIVANAN